MWFLLKGCLIGHLHYISIPKSSATIATVRLIMQVSGAICAVYVKWNGYVYLGFWIFQIHLTCRMVRILPHRIITKRRWNNRITLKLGNVWTRSNMNVCSNCILLGAKFYDTKQIHSNFPKEERFIPTHKRLWWNLFQHLLFKIYNARFLYLWFIIVRESP